MENKNIRTQYDYSKLRGKIIEKYGTIINYSKEMHIDPSSLSLKLNGKRDFTQREIKALAELLEIKGEEIGVYFFTQKNVF